jgi:uncharacterized protein (TIGR02300 family)
VAVARHFKNTLEAALEKEGLGTKRICPSCGARFYDLSRRPIECPKCRFAFEPEALLRTRRPRPDLREIAVPVAAPVPEPVEEEVVEEELAEPLEEEAEVVEEVEEELPEELPEAEAEAAAVPAAERRRKPKTPVVDEEEAAAEVEGEALVGEDEEVVVEGALVEDEEVADILEEDLDEEERR